MSTDPRNDALIDIALAVADGGEVPWDEVRSQLSPDDAAVVDALKVVRELTAARRSAVSSQPFVPARWGHLTILGASETGQRARYAARDDALGREVTLTLIGPLDGDAALTEQLLKHARLRTRVTHPHLAALYGADYVHDRVGYWSEHVHGRSLAEIVASGGRFGVARACEIVAAISDAVAAVHDAGIADGGISAANIIESGDRLVLLPSVSAQADGQQDGSAGAATDVIALSNLLYFLLSGQEIDTAIDSGALRDHLRQIRPDIREPLVSVLTNALSADSRHRYPTARALAKAIRQSASSRFGMSEWVIGFLVTMLVMLLMLWYAFATK